jgi:hypothetical protein
MRSASRWILIVVVVVVAVALGDRPSFALPEFSFANSRPAKATEEPVIPLPNLAPLPPSQADSLMVPNADGQRFPETRYDIFDVDLDDDGKPEQIAQIVRISAGGFYSRAWWGIYAGGKLDQVLYWAYPEERERLRNYPIPMSLRDRADTLSFKQNIPEFYPAVDIVKLGDLTGDGKSEIVIWMTGRAVSPAKGQGVVCPAVISPTPQGYKEIFRSQTVVAVCERLTPEKPKWARSTCFRIHSRLRKAGGALDLLLEPLTPATSPESLCKLVKLDERQLPHDPDEWMPPKPMGANAPVPKDWIISRWDGTRYGAYWFVKDVKLD